EMLRPLGRYAEGTKRVPETGPYVLEEGEAVVPTEQNPNADNPEVNDGGAPVDFNGPVYQNPRGLRPILDTETDTPTEGLHAPMNTQNAPVTGPQMDNSSAPVEAYGQPSMVQEMSNKHKLAPVQTEPALAQNEASEKTAEL